MKIENLIETPETLRARRRSRFNRVQYFCFGIAMGAFAGYCDAWWRALPTAITFLVAGIIVGAAKVVACRPARPRPRWEPSRTLLPKESR